MLTTIVMPLIGLVLGFGIAWLMFRRLRLDESAVEARTDVLTGLRNRRACHEELGRQFAQRQRQGVHFSLIMIDIDQFKAFNDAHGHLAGDRALQSVAQTLSGTLREMDFVFRYGGDEFAVLCPGSNLHEAAAGAERVREAIAAQPVSLKNGEGRVTISLGVAEVAPTEVAEGLIQRADEALYAAKRAGRNRVHRHNGDDIVPAMAVQARPSPN